MKIQPTNTEYAINDWWFWSCPTWCVSRPNVMSGHDVGEPCLRRMLSSYSGWVKLLQAAMDRATYVHLLKQSVTSCSIALTHLLNTKFKAWMALVSRFFPGPQTFQSGRLWTTSPLIPLQNPRQHEGLSENRIYSWYIYIHTQILLVNHPLNRHPIMGANSPGDDSLLRSPSCQLLWETKIAASKPVPCTTVVLAGSTAPWIM
jgi:hypothetical protein